MGNFKKCKGLHKLTYGLGCGELSSKRKYGLGYECGCFQNFIKSEKGLLYVEKHIIPKYKTKENDFNYAKETEKRSNQNYRSNVLQPLINKIIHLIDKDQPCIVKGVKYKNVDAGHFYSVGSNETLSLNLHNIFAQGTHSNRSKGGEPIEYLNGLIKTFGNDYANFILRLKQHKPLHLTKEELKSKAKICRLIIKELNLQNKTYTNKQRILLRNKYNLILDIYKLDHSFFKI